MHTKISPLRIILLLISLLSLIVVMAFTCEHRGVRKNELRRELEPTTQHFSKDLKNSLFNNLYYEGVRGGNYKKFKNR